METNGNEVVQPTAIQGGVNLLLSSDVWHEALSSHYTRPDGFACIRASIPTGTAQ